MVGAAPHPLTEDHRRSNPRTTQIKKDKRRTGNISWEMNRNVMVVNHYLTKTTTLSPLDYEYK
eukprot:11322831-Ditylum_brightwellii.AAC.1